MEQKYSGSCHCGNVKFDVELNLDDAIKCNCSLCSKKNAVMVRLPAEKFTMISGEDSLGTYQWNTKVAKHHFCTNCGIYTFHRPRSAPELYGINLACLAGVDVNTLTPDILNGAGLSLAGE